MNLCVKTYELNQPHLLGYAYRNHKTFKTLDNYPCRCLCRFSGQITLTLPLRRIILQFLQIFLTEVLTFILITHILPFPYQLSIKLSRTILT